MISDVFDFITFGRITKTIERNLLLIDLNISKNSETPRNPADNVKLVAAIERNVEEFQSLIHGDLAIQAIVASISQFIKILKICHIGAWHVSHSRFHHAANLAKNALNSLANVRTEMAAHASIDELNGIISYCDKLERDLNSVYAQCLGNLFLAGESVDAITSDVADIVLDEDFVLYDHAKVFHALRKEPKVIKCEQKPVPFRPILYDLAFSGVEFQAEKEKFEDKPANREPEKKGLLAKFGFW
jgi:hypothetical protein